jgi:signal transduction histidine kinase
MAVKKLKLIPKPLEMPEWLNLLDSPVVVYQQSTNEIQSNASFDRIFGTVDLQSFLKKSSLHLFNQKPITLEILTQPARYEEYTIENGSGTRFIVNLKVSAIVGEREERFIAFLDDVTDKSANQIATIRNHLQAVEAKNEQVRVLQQEKLEQIGRYAGGIMHNLSQPLQCIRGNTEELIATESLGAKGADHLEEIRKATNYLADIVRSFKSYVRIGDEDAAPISVQECIRQAVFFTRNTLLHENIDLDFEDHDLPLPMVHGKQAQLVQVFINLIGNARDAIEEAKRTRGKIGIRLEHQRNTLIATIRDNGIGMDEVTRRKIFEPFFTTKPQGKGTGLGLSTSYAYLREIQANIEVKSEPGTGSEFKLSFPIETIKGESHGK